MHIRVLTKISNNDTSTTAKKNPKEKGTTHKYYQLQRNKLKKNKKKIPHIKGRK